MAPQQNSTLIDELLLTSAPPSLLNSPEELQRYSPILPPKPHKQLQLKDVQKFNKKQNKKMLNKNSNNNKAHNNEALTKLAAQKASARQQPRAAAKCRNDAQQQTIAKASQALPADKALPEQGQLGRSRSISLHGVSCTLAQGHKEITIWLANGEPRYVSGVTGKTTCNDIIKALIDDAAAAAATDGNDKGVAAINCKQRVATKPGSRDYSDYVLTEFWRGIERSYDGNMAILPVWKAWSRVHNELRLTLKRRRDIEEPPKQPKSPSGFQSLRKYLNKIFGFTANSKKQKRQKLDDKSDECAKIKEKAAEKFLLSGRDEKIPDEFLFVILPENFQCPKHGSHLDGGAPIVEGTLLRPARGKLLSDRLYRLSETRLSTKRKSRKCIVGSCSSLSQTRKSKKDQQKLKKKHSTKKHRRRRSSSSNSESTTTGSRLADAEQCIKRRKDIARLHTASIRSKLAQKTSQMNQLYEREQALTKELSNKCRLFKMQNELYTHVDKHFELSVGQIQGSVEAYATDIIQTEQELLELKNAIRQDISLINNLKRLTLTVDANECGLIDELENKAKASPTIKEIAQVAGNATNLETPRNEKRAEMQFVDNIYEFCDNNGSMLV